jgi:hypothetical protein
MPRERVSRKLKRGKRNKFDAFSSQMLPDALGCELSRRQLGGRIYPVVLQKKDVGVPAFLYVFTFSHKASVNASRPLKAVQTIVETAHLWNLLFLWEVFSIGRGEYLA